MPAIPAIIGGGAAIGSALIGKSAANSAAQRSPEETNALNANTALAKQATDQGGQLFNKAMPAVSGGLNYYDTLLRGSRPAMAQATAGARADIGDTYSGADTALRTTMPGAGQARARAELNRGRAGQIARLTTGVQPMAAQGMAQIGTGLVGAANQGYQTASGINTGTLNNGMANRMQANQVGAGTSANFGRLFAQILALTKGGSGAQILALTKGGSGAQSSSGGSAFGGYGPVPGEDM